MSSPKVSFVVATEGRSEWMPWLLWNFQRQNYPNLEMVVVHARTQDSQLEPFKQDPRVKLVAGPENTYCGHKRNIGLEHVTGDFICWWDDDDWYHPDRTSWLVDAFQPGDEYVGWGDCAWVDLKTLRVCPYHIPNLIVPVLALIPTEIARTYLMDPQDHVADGTWTQKVVEQKLRKKKLPQDLQRVHSLWFAHDRNTPRRYHWSPKYTFDAYSQIVGAEKWGDTTEQLKALQIRVFSQ